MNGATAAPLLEVDGLTVEYATGYGPLRAVDDVSFSIAPGRALGLVGESGSGKSTVAMTLLDLLGPEAGMAARRFSFEGLDLLDPVAAHRKRLRGDRIAIVFQDPGSALNPALAVGRQIAEPLVRHRGLTPSQAAARVQELLAEVGIPRPAEVAAAYPHQLSGGMKQRALIATALGCEPRLMVLDEPTTALDVTIEAQILDLLEELRRRHDLSILFVSHNLGVIERVCDDVCVLYAGRVVEQGAAGAVFASPSHPYTRGLLGSLPRPTAERLARLTPIPGRLPDLVAPPAGCIFAERCAYAEAACHEPQAPRPLADGRAVRCWKAERLGEAAPVSGDGAGEAAGDGADAAAPAHAPDPAAAPLVETERVEKVFRLGRGLGGWTLDFSGGFPIKTRSVRLQAVDGVSITVRPAEVLGLVGESGCGKSTLGRLILRLIDPSGGAVRIAGQDITTAAPAALRPARRLAQMVFQNPDSSLNPRHTVGQIVRRPLELFGLARGAEAERRVADLLGMVRLSPDYASRYPHQLSGGEKQRVSVARALATEPRFIVLDEATSALDVSVQAAILNLLADLRDRLGVAYLLISHDLSVIAHLADRVAVMYRGAVVEEGPSAAVMAPPYHPYTEALLSAVPVVGARHRSAGRVRLRGALVGTDEIQGCRFAERCPRRIGPVCDTLTPPEVEAAPGHRLACHLPLETLRAAAPVFGAEAASQ